VKKGRDSVSTLLNFPTLGQMQKTASVVTEEEKAMKLENAYLKSQVAALKQMVEEEQQKANLACQENLELTQMDMQYQMVIGRALSPQTETRYFPSPENSPDNLDNQGATSEFGTKGYNT
jgi:ribosomal protein L1